MKEASVAKIDGFLETAAIELFASHGLSLGQGSAPVLDREIPFVASIGFVSPVFKGVLVMTVSKETAALTLPENLRKPELPPEILADWTGELANQMLGRIKNKLCQVGIEIALSTPLVFFGKEVRHFSQRSPLERCLDFGGEGHLEVEFKADFDSGFELGESAPEESCGTPEGEAVFF